MTTAYVIIADHPLLKVLYNSLRPRYTIYTSFSISGNITALCLWHYQNNERGLGVISDSIDPYIQNPHKLNTNSYRNFEAHFMDLRYSL